MVRFRWGWHGFGKSEERVRVELLASKWEPDGRLRMAWATISLTSISIGPLRLDITRPGPMEIDHGDFRGPTGRREG